MTVLPALKRLEHLEPVFAVLIRGRHVNRLHDPWWTELEREQATYTELFALLGYHLLLDPRGFACFHTEEPALNTGNKTRNLALFMLALFESKADEGMDLTRFHDWVIDHSLLDDLLQGHESMLEAEGQASRDALAATLASAVTYGFAVPDGSGRWRLLPATWRYLDSFETLAADIAADAAVLEDES